MNGAIQLEESCYGHRRHGIQLNRPHSKEPNQAPDRGGKGSERSYLPLIVEQI